MRLKKFRVTNYRSIRDSGWCEVEHDKTILVGPNEAGKSALLMALQQLKPPDSRVNLKALRDYPRSLYNDITTGRASEANSPVVVAHFTLDAEDMKSVEMEDDGIELAATRYMDGRREVAFDGGPPPLSHKDLDRDLTRMASHVVERTGDAGWQARLEAVRGNWIASTVIDAPKATQIRTWLQQILPHVDEDNEREEGRHASLTSKVDSVLARSAMLKSLEARLPTFVLFSNYHRVRPRLHLQHLASRLQNGVLDDDAYDYGNECLLKLLGFTASALAQLGAAAQPPAGNAVALQNYQDQLDKRDYQLNAASVALTEKIVGAWNPNTKHGEASRLRVKADGQYLKVVVEDELGVEVELDQRSEGFQWLVSFFVVFFAELQDKHRNAILLLDEPGLSLHGLKQREFRSVLSDLAKENQTLYTTHSPFLVGPDELDLVRVVEMTDRKTGTKVHTTLTAGDSAALLPLQEALGYDLAQSLFAQTRNLVCEGLTDYWYVDATAQLLAEAGDVALDSRIALIPANGAGKVAYFATILHAHKLKVAALLDSDAAGDSAARQDALVGTLKNRGILRTKDAYRGPVKNPEIEDLLRETLLYVAKEHLDIDAVAQAAKQPNRSVIKVLENVHGDPLKYKLAKAYLRWTREHSAADLSAEEREGWCRLLKAVNKALK